MIKLTQVHNDQHQMSETCTQGNQGEEIKPVSVQICQLLLRAN